MSIKVIVNIHKIFNDSINISESEMYDSSVNELIFHIKKLQLAIELQNTIIYVDDSNDIKDGKLFISGYDIWLFPEEFEYL